MGAAVLRWPTLPEQGELLPPESFGQRLPEKISPPIAKMGTAETTAAICRAIREHFDGQRDAPKRLARIANSNTRAARNWLEGVNAPDALYLLRLMAEIPELQAEVRRLTGMQSDLNPQFDQAMQHTMQLFIRMRQERN